MIDTDIAKEIICERLVGYTINAIATKHGCSQSAVKSICRKNQAWRGMAKKELVNAAKKRIIEDAQLTETVVLAASASILADFDLSHQIKQSASLLLESIYNNDSGIPIAQRARSLAAVATSASIAQAIAIKALEFQKSYTNQSDSDLPSLHINSFSDSEIEEIRITASMTDLELAAYESQKGMVDSGAIE